MPKTSTPLLASLEIRFENSVNPYLKYIYSGGGFANQALNTIFADSLRVYDPSAGLSSQEVADLLRLRDSSIFPHVLADLGLKTTTICSSYVFMRMIANSLVICVLSGLAVWWVGIWVVEVHARG